ncbi:hypothetical protein [Nocardia arizonensis]|nr:hypothetical protein [Nocardia arizonensis]
MTDAGTAERVRAALADAALAYVTEHLDPAVRTAHRTLRTGS